jgi:flavin-dependent dehydrogenase
MVVTGTATSWNNLSDGPWDAIVIGAGPAGALAAREMATAGASVLMIEKRVFPRSKVCGACLNGRALGILGDVGLGSLATGSGGVALREFRLHFRKRRVCLALPIGMALSRHRLDAELVEAAIDSGARFLSETRAQIGETGDGIRRVHLTCGGQTQVIGSRVVLAAPGLGGSCLPPAAPMRVRIARGSRIGAGCRITLASSGYEQGTIFMAVGRHGYVGLVRVEGGSLNVAAAFEPELVRRHGTMGAAASAVLAEAGLPALDELESARWQGTPPLTRQTRPIAAERLFLLGDAAGYVEPFTGEGIAWALASGRAIAPLALRGIACWDSRQTRDWNRLHRRLVRQRQMICRAGAAMLHRPWLTVLGFEILARLPGAASGVIRSLNATPSLSEVR